MKQQQLVDPSLIQTASEWFSRLQQSPVSAEHIVAWLNWYESDERHKMAYDDMRSFWDQSNALRQDSAFMETVEREISTTTAVVGNDMPTGGAMHRFWLSMAELLAPKRLWSAAALSAIVAAAMVTEHIGMDVPDSPIVKMEGPHAFGSAFNAATQTIPRGAPELVKEAYLSDGSQVALAEKSAVSVQFSKKTRYLVMDHGIALFTVAHNRNRPFIVRAGDFYVRAVGTAFNVRSNDSRLIVTVTQGSVEIYPVDKSVDGDVPDSGFVKAEAGKEIAWSEPSSSPVVSQVNAARALAWENGILEYLNEPLGSAIDDVTRYSSHPIIVRDPAIRTFLVSGTVFMNSTDAWLKSLPRLFPVEVTVDKEGNYVIDRRPSTMPNHAVS